MKLDLSKNKLQQLPADFGRLVNLQHLDLLNNRLVTLPVSFAQLKVTVFRPRGVEAGCESGWQEDLSLVPPQRDGFPCSWHMQGLSSCSFCLP